jgi:alpha-tubulin suppressor-like RCC1 family protein
MRCSVLVGVAIATWAVSFAGCKGRFALPPDARFVREVAVSEAFACARMKDGSVRCWGANDAGQLGDGTVTDRHEAVRVAAATPFTAVATGAHHACAITADGDVYCWGANDAGQAGGASDAPRVPRLTPGRVDVGHARALALGARHSCALLEGGAVRCWGADQAGQVTGASAATGATVIAAAADATCIIDAERRAACWGTVPGRLSTSYGRIEGLADVTSIAVGPLHACAARAWGGVACWGSGAEGQLGNGALADQGTPVEVSGLAAPAKSVVAGRTHTCASLSDDTVRCWGANAESQLADGMKAHRASAFQVQGVFQAVRIAAAGDATCAVLGDGSARCWGGLPLPKTDVVPVVVPTEVRW